MNTVGASKIDFFEKLLYIMPGFLYWKNVKGQFVGCNRNEELLFGLNHWRDISGLCNKQLIGEKLAEIIDDADSAIVERKNPCILEEVGFNLLRDEAIYFTKKMPVFDELGNVLGLFGVSLDITAKHPRAKTLAIAKEKILYSIDYFTNLLNAIAKHTHNKAKFNVKFLSATIFEVMNTLLEAFRLGFHDGLMIQNIVDKTHLLLTDRLVNDCSPLVIEIFENRSQELLHQE